MGFLKRTFPVPLLYQLSKIWQQIQTRKPRLNLTLLITNYELRITNYELVLDMG